MPLRREAFSLESGGFFKLSSGNFPKTKMDAEKRSRFENGSAAPREPDRVDVVEQKQ
jgi:hypothetical protein